jgi:predicted DsbA family dithiol-disulfide isomerase
VLHDALMQAGEKIAEVDVFRAATAVGLDVERLKRDMADPAIEEAIARNRALAAELGINGTPGFVLADRVVPGAVDKPTLEGLIDEVRAKAKAGP